MFLGRIPLKTKTEAGVVGRAEHVLVQEHVEERRFLVVVEVEAHCREFDWERVFGRRRVKTEKFLKEGLVGMGSRFGRQCRTFLGREFT